MKKQLSALKFLQMYRTNERKLELIRYCRNPISNFTIYKKRRKFLQQFLKPDKKIFNYNLQEMFSKLKQYNQFL
jgi:hypothetical protein